jgi:hypothetical protein
MAIRIVNAHHAQPVFAATVCVCNGDERGGGSEANNYFEESIHFLFSE